MKKLFWVILLLGGSITNLLAETQKDPISLYLKVEDLPTKKPITHLLSFNGLLMVGNEDGLFVQNNDKSWKAAIRFPHRVVQLQQSDNRVWVLIEKSKRDIFSDQWWFSSKDGHIWEQIGKPTSRPALAHDSKHHIIYRANKDIKYQSALFAFTAGRSRLLGDSRLARINALAVQPSSGYLLVGTHRELYLSKNQGRSFMPLNQKLGIETIRAGHIYHLFANEHYIAVQVDSHRIFLSSDSGDNWKELTQSAPLTTPKGAWHLHQIMALEDSQMVVRKNNQYIVMNLADVTFRHIHLPRYYRYKAFNIHGDDLYITTAPLADGILSNLGQKNTLPKVAPLLKLSLKPEPLCRLLSGNQKPEKRIIVPKNSKLIVDNDSLYILGNNHIWDGISQKKPMGVKLRGWNFSIGSKGHWYLNNGAMPNSKGKFTAYHLLRSKDKGKSWQNTGLNVGKLGKFAHDDSLEVIYSHYLHRVSRTGWRNNHTTQHRFMDEEGVITQLQVDADSRLWVTTTNGLSVSEYGGFNCIILPFKTHPDLPITGFGLMKHHMVINYDGRIYIARKDIKEWKAYPIADPCKENKMLDVRLVGNSDKLLVLQEQQYGHIWVYDPKTGDKERFYFPRDNGVVRKAHILDNQQLLVETTGVPIIPNGDGSDRKGKRYSAIFSYTIHLKS